MLFVWLFLFVHPRAIVCNDHKLNNKVTTAVNFGYSTAMMYLQIAHECKMQEFNKTHLNIIQVLRGTCLLEMIVCVLRHGLHVFEIQESVSVSVRHDCECLCAFVMYVLFVFLTFQQMAPLYSCFSMILFETACSCLFLCLFSVTT